MLEAKKNAQKPSIYLVIPLCSPENVIGVSTNATTSAKKEIVK